MSNTAPASLSTAVPSASSSSSSSSSSSFTPLPGNLTITDQANAFLEPEIEYRLRYIIQEAWKIAKQSHKDTLLPIHVELAWKMLSNYGRDGVHSITSAHWIPHAGSASSRLCVGKNTIPITPVPSSILHSSLQQANQIIDNTITTTNTAISPLSTANTSSSSSHDTSSTATTTREASALLAAITTAISTSSDTNITATNEMEENDENSIIMKITTLLVQFQLNSAQQLQFFIPKIISILRSTLETNILNLNQSINSPNTTASLLAYRQQRKILRIITALITNYNIPIESIIGEILAILCSIILYQISIIEPNKLRDYNLLIQDDSRTRNYASKVLTALVHRYANIWPDIHSQASLVILDGLSNSIELMNTEDKDTMVDEDTSLSSSTTSLRIVSWNSLYGAAITLSTLPKVPVDAVIPLTTILRQYITERYTSTAPVKQGISTYDQQWSTLGLDALQRILQQHGKDKNSSTGTEIENDDDI